MKIFTKIIKHFQSSILAEYLPMLFIVLVLFLGISYVRVGTYKDTFVYKSNNPICPNDFKDSKKKITFLHEWSEEFLKNNPDASIADISKARVDFWIDNNCKEVLRKYANGMVEKYSTEILKELQSKKTSICSDEYKNRGDYLIAVTQWFGDFYDKHPADITRDEMLFARKNFLIESDCKETSMDSEISSEPQKSDVDESISYNTPVINLSLRYFTDDSIAWSNIGEEGVFDNKNTWELATVDGGDAYQSFPTKIITLSADDFFNEDEQMPPIKLPEEILFDADILKNRFKEQLTEYGELAQRFLPNYYITSIKKFDVDNDGENETIIGICSGGNHCPDKIIIVKDDTIIFTTHAGAVGPKVTKSNTSNGFYVEWAPWLNDGSKWDTGLCCLPGHMKTRFIFENDKFIPVYEQEVLYFKVENTD
jgi:hypothetical protein